MRSPPCLCSDPPIMRTSRCDDPSRCLVSPPAPRPGRRISPLADAGDRGGDAPGPTVPYWIRQRARARPEPGQCAYQRHLFFCDAWLTSSSSPSSARFPSIHLRSRNRSPPCPPVWRSRQGNACGPPNHPGGPTTRTECCQVLAERCRRWTIDRMLVARARCKGLTLVTRDPQIHRYDVDLLGV